MTDLPSVADVRADLSAILTRFRAGQTRAFSFGAGVPEAVVLTYDEFEDLGGESKFVVGAEVLEPGRLAGELAAVVAAARAGDGAPVVWGESGVPEAVHVVILSARAIADADASKTRQQREERIFFDILKSFRSVTKAKS